MILSKFLFRISSVLLIFTTSCSKEEVCEEAVLRVCNPSDSTAIPYAWLQTSITDTLWPGDCTEQIIYNSIGNGTSEGIYFHHINGGNMFVLEDCEFEYMMDRGHVNLKKDCSNGQFDPGTGETDTDCGGFCDPCPELSLPCDVLEDRIEFSQSSLNNTATNVNIDESLDEVRIRFDMSMARLHIWCKTEGFPREGRKFITSPSQGELSSERAYVGYDDGWNQYGALENQEIYLIKNDSDNWAIKFCDLTFDFEGDFYTADAHFTLTRQ